MTSHHPSPAVADFERFVVVDYVDELRDLPATYAAAVQADVSELAAWLRDHGDRPLVALGAGGSLAIAELAATLHHRATGQVGASREPMDLYLLDQAANTALLLVTASGGHSDSLACCQLLPQTGVDAAVFCGKSTSNGADLLAGTDVPVFAFELLPDVHGWVAVNVLLAQAVVLARAFVEAYPSLGEVPGELSAFLSGSDVDSFLDDLTETLRAPLARPNLIFLHGPDTRAAAIDLDSKFAESGLGALTSSEYRNFAHGRYQMMLPQLTEVGVIAMYGRREATYAESSLAVLPAAVPHAALRVPGESPAAEQIGALVHLLFLVGALGNVRGIDVGWGSRNTFGDLLYDLDPLTLLPHPPR